MINPTTRTDIFSQSRILIARITSQALILLFSTVIGISTSAFAVSDLEEIIAVEPLISPSSEQIEKTHLQLSKSLSVGRILLQKLMMNYHLTTAEQISSAYQAKLRLSADQVESELKNIDQLLLQAKLTGESTDIKKHWRKFARLLSHGIEQLEGKGYADVKLTEKMVTNVQLLDRSLQVAFERIKTDSKVENSNANTARSLSQLMQRIANKYAERSASLHAGKSYQQKSVTIDLLAEQFDIQLENLQNNGSNSREIKNKLQQIALKWEYIETYLRDKSQPNISFLVSYYSKDMVYQLMAIADIFDAQDA